MSRARGQLRAIVGLLLLLSIAPGRADQALVWSIQLGDGTRDWLAGSFHLLPAEAAELPRAYARAMETAQQLVLESDLETLSNPAMAQGMLSKAMAPPGGLRALIGAPLYQRFEAYSAELGLPVEGLSSFRPWFVAMSLEVLNYTQAGFRPDLGVDQRLLRQARTRGMTVRWLESPQAHSALLADMPLEMEKTFLAATLDEATRAAPADLLTVWRSGDLKALDQLAVDMRASYPQLYRRLLSDRNRQWLSPILQMLRDDQSQLILVGAAHLAGDDGLLQLLEAYQVQAQRAR